jgi:hypothetical protein
MEHLGHLLLPHLQPRRVFAVAIAQLGRALGFIEGHVLVHLALEPLGQNACVTAKGSHDVPVQPAAFVLECAGQVPVVERDHRLNAVGDEFIHQVFIELQTLFIDLAISVGDDTRPADGEAVGPDIVRSHQGHVFLVPVVAVTGHVAGVAVFHILAGHLMAEVVPDVGPLAVLIPCALALVGGAGYAPDKFFGKCAHTVTST